MGKWLSADERKLIDQLEEQGYKPHEIGAKMGRDTRTVKHYLNERPRERSLELERQQQELEHRDEIRNLIKRLERSLEFPLPEELDITDLSKGEIGFAFPSRLIRWQQADGGSYMVKLEDEFNLIIEHLHSSRRKEILNMVKEWQRIGGKCIVDCHRLRGDIQKEAEKQTRLVTIADSGLRGLLEGFSWTIYRCSLCNVKEENYMVSSKLHDLCLLHWGMYNLAWVRNDEVERTKDIHRRLIGYYRRMSTTLDILEGKKQLSLLRESLCQRLDKFASLSKLPGKCGLCPSN